MHFLESLLGRNLDQAFSQNVIFVHFVLSSYSPSRGNAPKCGIAEIKMVLFSSADCIN